MTEQRARIRELEYRLWDRDALIARYYSVRLSFFRLPLSNTIAEHFLLPYGFIFQMLLNDEAKDVYAINITVLVLRRL